eukprot:CAMPEP_0198111702 /NCGR_PEP_ID=MMETSP1442-20131203/3643_1 /TAXON_ID= /ORGANISM="Craspedostauros australis, Strain CCMP3328" /LENGTH=44 /DNA_ID= /DNA_START= /DNA_END= /DNA_ORIENTATION=
MGEMDPWGLVQMALMGQMGLMASMDPMVEMDLMGGMDPMVEMDP